MFIYWCQAPVPLRRIKILFRLSVAFRRIFRRKGSFFIEFRRFGIEFYDSIRSYAVVLPLPTRLMNPESINLFNSALDCVSPKPVIS